MSHFTVMVIGPSNDDELAEMLAPYDENKDVDPYRDYLEGEAKDHWYMEKLRRDFAAVERAAAADPVDALEDKVIRAAKSIISNLEEPTWEEFVTIYNLEFEDPNDRVHYDEKTGRAYELTSYNPDSKWDWYEVGGRWAGTLRLKGERPPGQELNFSWGWKDTPDDERPGKDRADRAQLKDIDLDGWREEARADAEAKYDRYEEFVALHGEHPKWDWEGNKDRIQEYRQEYNNNPVVVAAREFFKNSGMFFNAGDEFGGKTREEYVASKVAGAVPCYATLTEDGWLAPGKMGWFGMSSDGDNDRVRYHAEVNKMLDELDPETWITVVDCHI